MEMSSATDIAARLGATSVDGKIDMVHGLLNGALDFSGPNLAELAPLIGTDLGGSAKGKVVLRSRSGKQDVTLDVTADSLTSLRRAQSPRRR